MRLCDMHPLSLLIYFASVICFTMITMNPILLLIAFLGALSGVVIIKRRTDLKLYIPLFIIIALTNPLFSHNGETVLFFFRNQRITLEAVFYGIGAALLITATVYLFKLFGLVFGTDKLTWAVGALSPKLSVVLTMAMRFIPLFKKNAADIYNARISLGVYDAKSFGGRLKLGASVFSALISISAENAVDTADTMRARGFGRGKRTSYSLFKMTKRDIIFISAVILCDISTAVFLALHAADFSYYPVIRCSFNVLSPALYAVYTFLFFMPFLNDAKEVLRWKYLISKI